MINDETNDEELEVLELTDNDKIIKPIQIFPYQKEHFKKVLTILQNELGYLDVSPFGCGKTHIALAVAATFKMDILVVGPKTVLTNWKKQAKIYGIKLYGALTYSALRGTERNGVNHELLEREGDDFFATEKLEEYARQGLLMVFDECHSLKNEKSQQLDATQALTKEMARLARMGYTVRIAALSATPADKKENITSMFKLLGIINSENLYKYDRSSKTYMSVGLQEAINKCNKYDPDTTFHVICRPLNKSTAKLICHELYTRILKKHITSSMPEPPIKARKDVKNLFAIMPPEDVERLKQGALLFSSATSYKHETSEINYSSVNWGDVILSRREIDSSKVNTMVRLAKQNLDSDPNCKVVLYFTFKRDMKESMRQLEKYGPLLMNGDVIKAEERTKLMDKFQQHDNEHRVFISNPKVGGLGVELDDKYGDQPRFMYIAPSYMFIDQFQATGRIHRKETKSKATIRFVYSRDFPYEDSIFQSMAEKSKVARDMLLSSEMNSVIFPGEIDEEIERRPGENDDEE